MKRLIAVIALAAGFAFAGGALAQALVRAVRVVVREVLVEDLPGVVLVDQHAVGALAADGLDEPFDVAVRLQRPGRDLHHLDALVSKDGVERADVLAVAIADLLRRPLPGRVRRHPEQMHPPCADLHRHQHVQPAQQHGVHVEEVDGQQTFRLRAEKGPPPGVHAAWGRPDPGCGEDASAGNP